MFLAWKVPFRIPRRYYYYCTRCGARGRARVRACAGDSGFCTQPSVCRQLRGVRWIAKNPMAHRSTSDSTPGPSPPKDRAEHDERGAANGIAESEEDLLLLDVGEDRID